MPAHDMSKQLSTAERFAALSRVGTALMSELDETRLLHLIAETACELTGATFAAFTLRPINEEGEPIVPSEGNLFRLAAVVGVTKEQEELFRHMSLGGEGLLAPIFRHGVSVRIPDAIAHIAHHEHQSHEARDAARETAFAYAHGQVPSENLRSMGVPRGHPLVRSFLGAPLLDRDRRVRGGLLLGHEQPGRFTQEDETLLVGLAAQAAVALENARLYRSVQRRVQELDAMFESIVDGVTLVDTHGQIRRENGSARHLREMLEASPHGVEAVEALLHVPAQRALQGETAQEIEVTISLEQKETRAYSVNASPLHHVPSSTGLSEEKDVLYHEQHPGSGAVVVWHDVTESRNLLVERQVRTETEARLMLLQLIIDELPSSVYLVQGYDARLVLANRATAQVWGAPWSHGQPMHQFLEEYGIRIFGVDGDVLAEERFATLRALQQGETVRQHQEVIRHPDGTSLPVLVNAVSLSIPQLHISLSSDIAPLDGTESLALVVHQDVTALKEAEHLKDEFIGIAAHELRSPLAVLKGFAETLLVQTARGRGSELSEWQIEALQGIDQATGRLVELTEDLLDVTRLQAGRLELYLEPTDLVALTQRTMARIQMTTPYRLALHTSLQHLVVRVDPRRIEQVLTNLISNAIKYSPEADAIEVTISELQDEKLALMSVCDHGIGIPTTQQSHIFGRFVRADNATARGISGTGLGLYLCRALVERHNGRIWFESSEGEGSTFFIILPVCEEDQDVI